MIRRRTFLKILLDSRQMWLIVTHFTDTYLTDFWRRSGSLIPLFGNGRGFSVAEVVGARPGLAGVADNHWRVAGTTRAHLGLNLQSGNVLTRAVGLGAEVSGAGPADSACVDVVSRSRAKYQDLAKQSIKVRLRRD
jgi:hypothetical protein